MMQGSQRLPDHDKDFGQRLSDEIRDNPVPAALVGMGLLWLFMGGNRTTISQMGLDNAASGTSAGATLASQMAKTGKQAGEALFDSASSAARAAGQTASELTSDATEGVSNAAVAVQRGGAQLARTLQRDLSDLLERQPLVVGALGLAMGAAIGTAFATTQVEAQTFGEASDALKAEVEHLVSSGMDTARDLGSRLGRE